MESIDVDVCIVGAGFAGLACARALERAGRTAVVLEARDRVGGRVHTQPRDAGSWIDVGGQWVGPTQERLYALARELGVPTFPTHTEGKNLLYVEGKEARRFSGTIPLPVGPVALANIAWLLFRGNQIARTIPIDRPWEAPNAHALDRRTLADFLDDHARSKTARRLVEVAFDNVFACDADEISLLFALSYVRSAGSIERLIDVRGGAQQDRVKGGMQTIADRLRASLRSRVLFESPVTKVEQDDDGVRVESARAVVKARRVVVAVPPKLASAIAFDPAVPAGRAALWDASIMGSVIKCTAVYSSPFWRARGLSGQAVSDEGIVRVTFDNSIPGSPEGMLTGFIEGGKAREWADRTDEERRAAVLACFARYFGDEALRPIDYVDRAWRKEPWSGGCYVAFLPPGALTEHGPNVRKPFGRLHFAGTETAIVWNGYIEGALESAERAARECLAAL